MAGGEREVQWYINKKRHISLDPAGSVAAYQILGDKVAVDKANGKPEYQRKTALSVGREKQHGKGCDYPYQAFIPQPCNSRHKFIHDLAAKVFLDSIKRRIV